MKQKLQSWGWPILGLTLAVALFAGYLLAQTKTNLIETKIKPNADGTVAVLFRGEPGKTYQIESAGDISAWSVAATNLAAIDGWTEWVDTRGGQQRFYRVALQTTTAAAATNESLATASAVSTKEDGSRLLTALNQNNYSTVLDILRQYGIAENILTAMANNFGQTPGHATLSDAFLKGVEALPLTGKNVQAHIQAATALGYDHPIFKAHWLYTNWAARCDAQLAQCPVSPIGVFNVKPDDLSFIELFKWYDRYAERLHSVVIYPKHLSVKIREGDLSANEVVEGLRKLIKARKPDTFVWVGVPSTGLATDLQWLQALSFKPDGLAIMYMRQFNAKFETTRSRYLQAVGENTPMMAMGFFGYYTELESAQNALSTAKRTKDDTAKTAALAHIREIGKVVGDQLPREEEQLRQLGYRGLSVQWVLLQAVDEAKK